MNFRRIAKLAGIVLIVLFALIQLIPVDRTNPAVTQEIQWDSPETAALAQRACYDCHSNQTVWPWYSYVAPISIRVADHVEHGRRHLNFSEWDQPQDADDMVDVIVDGEMPLSDYLLLHPEADLSDIEKEMLINGIKLTLSQDPPIER